MWFFWILIAIFLTVCYVNFCNKEDKDGKNNFKSLSHVQNSTKNVEKSTGSADPLAGTHVMKERLLLQSVKDRKQEIAEEEKIRLENELLESESEISIPSTNCDFYELNHAAFEGDSKKLLELVETCENIDVEDHHGNTPMHLAVMLGHTDCVRILRNHGASFDTKNNDQWTSLHEAISRGDKEILDILVNAVDEKVDAMKGRLLSIPDFYMEIVWKLKTWIPLLTGLLPTFETIITKKENWIRVDTDLEKISKRGVVKGDYTYIYSPDDNLIKMDHNSQTAEKHLINKYLVDSGELQKNMDDILEKSIETVWMSTKNISFFKSKKDSNQKVGKYNATFYDVVGLRINVKERREHLLTSGPPPKSKMTWTEYLRSPRVPQLGRPLDVKESYYDLTATIGMSEDFPLSVETLFPILRMIAPQLKIFKKLENLLSLELPPGFPVRLTVPIIASFYANVEFGDFQWRGESNDSRWDDSNFRIPDNYTVISQE